MSAAPISIVVPTRDSAATLPELLLAIRRQRTAARVEVVVVDSTSTDGTADIARRDADVCVTVPRERFNHGTTRNLGIQQTSGELIVMLVQDALPADVGWLDALTAPFGRDALLAGTFARQVARPDASAIARESLRGWVAASPEGRTVSLAGVSALERLTPDERLRLCAFDNVCACIRRSVWEQHPFRPTTIAEDLEWSREVLLAGYRLAYVPEAAVVHSHDRSLLYEFQRTRALHERLFHLFGVHTIPTLGALARSIAATVLVHARWERSLARFPRALALAVLWPLAQYLGGRAARSAATVTRTDP